MHACTAFRSLLCRELMRCVLQHSWRGGKKGGRKSSAATSSAQQPQVDELLSMVPPSVEALMDMLTQCLCSSSSSSSIPLHCTAVLPICSTCWSTSCSKLVRYANSVSSYECKHIRAAAVAAAADAIEQPCTLSMEI
eukprot:11722-Heterococcus_DN1.PRE.2